MENNRNLENKSARKISFAEQRLYPHLKITGEPFPRLLVTRKIHDDDAEYFGAFLPETGVRLLLEFINKTFRLRTCEIDIDGSFDVPCAQFYRKRCVAPCVASLCDRESYARQVEMVRLFLQKNESRLKDLYLEKIENCAESFDYEKAGQTRDELLAIENIFSNKDWNYWLSNAVDTFEIEKIENKIYIYLVTQRGRKTLGKRVFVFETDLSETEVLAQATEQFYKFHAPREIRVPFDFPNRKPLIKILSERAKRQIKFTVFGAANDRKTSIHAIGRAKYEFDFRQIKPPVKTADVLRELKFLFNLSRPPQKIEAFDAAHISGADFTAAKVAWKNGVFVTNENEFWMLDEASEIESLEKAIGKRFNSNERDAPDLLLIDGGTSQIRAAIKATHFLKNRKFQIIGAVKPPNRHGEISYFITEDGNRIEFSGDSEAMKILLRLRDEAHDLANDIHRQRRETAHFYELAQLLPSINEAERRELLKKFGSLKTLSEADAEDLKELLDVEKIGLVLNDLKSGKGNLFAPVKPLIVPLRFDDANGDARDLQPIGFQESKRQK